ncbi:MAG: GCN5-related N-acetyltransferase [Frankiales bacterium]|nr:GCN5-related N-acetyltransferase [Frankiales bacterium]
MEASGHAPEQLRLRPASLADAPAVARLCELVQGLHFEAMPEEFTGPDPVALLAFFQARLPERAVVVLLAELAGHAVGYLYAEEVHRPPTELTQELDILYVHHMAVAPEARRTGIGTALMAEAEQYATRHQLTDLRLDVWAFNEQAERFYSRLGFAPAFTRMKR